MANKLLNDKYNMPFGREWVHKDGGNYMVLIIKHLVLDTNMKIPVVTYMKLLEEDDNYFLENNIKNQFVRTVEHFKNSFKIKGKD
jgi:hypothetical protein